MPTSKFLPAKSNPTSWRVFPEAAKPSVRVGEFGNVAKISQPSILGRPLRHNLVLDGNPCHQEATEVAERVGADFLINVTMDENKALTGIFAGHWRLAFERATASLAEAVLVPVVEPYDVIVTVDATINHYQAAKAAVGALPVLD